MEERRKIDRVEFDANSVIVDRATQKKYFGRVKNVSPLGIAIVVDEKVPDLVGNDVIIVAETLIMYADCVRKEDPSEGKQLFAFTAKRFTEDVLLYLFDRIGDDE